MPFRGLPGDKPEIFCNCFLLKGGNLWLQARDLFNLRLRSMLPDWVSKSAEVPRDLDMPTATRKRSAFDLIRPVGSSGHLKRSPLLALKLN
jgi:hypothetical protein